MITSSIIGTGGRLGSMIFQYAALLAVGIEKGYEIKVPDYNNIISENQKCLLGSFNISAQIITPEEKKKIIHTYKQEMLNFKCYKYDPALFKISDWTNVIGCFLNYEFYKKHEDIIIKELIPRKDIIEHNLETLSKVKNKYSGYEIVSIHLRRGDMLTQDIPMSPKIYDDDKWFRYFYQSKKYFENRKVKFFIFTGGGSISSDTSIDKDIDWCKSHLNGDEYIYWDYDRNTINDFTLQYLCDHHILSSNSGFSLGVGFLNNKKPNKLIIAPKKWHYFVQELDKGFYPDNYILI